MLRLQTYPPLVRGLIAGLLYAGIIWILGILEEGPVAGDLMIRVIFGFAAGLVFQQVTDGASLQKGARSVWNPHR